MRGIKTYCAWLAGYYVLGPKEKVVPPKKYMSWIRYQYYVEYNQS